MTILSKKHSKVVKFIHKALTTDKERETLQCVVLRPELGYAGAADGFRLHAVPADAYPAPDGVDLSRPDGWHGKPEGKLTPGSEYELVQEALPRPYPDLGEVRPKRIAVQIHFNPAFVIDALKEMDPEAGVTLRIAGRLQEDGSVKADPTGPFELIGALFDKDSGDFTPAYALVMPKYMGEESVDASDVPYPLVKSLGDVKGSEDASTSE